MQTVRRVSNKGDVICASDLLHFVQKERKKNFEGEGRRNIKKKSRRSLPEVYVDQRDSALALKSGSDSMQEIQSSVYQDEISPWVTEPNFD